MNFGQAMDLLRSGGRVTRLAWGESAAQLVMQRGELVLRRSDSTAVVLWKPEQADLLANDWTSPVN